MHYVVINTRTGNMIGLPTQSLEAAKAEAHKLHKLGITENGTKIIIGIQSRETIYTPQSLDEALKEDICPVIDPTGPRKICDIAYDIKRMWPSVNFAARPYLDAMFSLHKISDSYYADSAESIVRYFLSNATTWRGPDAKRIKAELKSILGEKVRA